MNPVAATQRSPRNDGPGHIESPLDSAVPFVDRHIGPRRADIDHMLSVVGYASLTELADAAVPQAIRWLGGLDLPAAGTEVEVAAELRRLASHNTVARSMMGLGYHDNATPPVIRRNVLENPAWYTAYTPYQPEISQGRLEALLAFQTVISDLTALPIAGSSLLDEPTAAAEAMTLARRANKSHSHRFLIDRDTHPQTIAVMQTRAEPLGIKLVEIDLDSDEAQHEVSVGHYFGALLSYPGSTGTVRQIGAVIEAAHAHGAVVAVASDLMALTLITPPGEMGADIVVGSAQRFGVPLGFGGPHAGFMAVREGLERAMPGRLVGVSVDADAAPAFRLALQTREQHIRRERATSNICTAQVLLAVTSALYAAYHGPDGLHQIASRIHRYAVTLAAGLEQLGVEIPTNGFFDTITARVAGQARDVVTSAERLGINLRLVDDDLVGIATDETTCREDLLKVWAAFADVLDHDLIDESAIDDLAVAAHSSLPSDLMRTSAFLTHETFNAYRSETAMLRYLRKLSDKDIALDRAMIPLGSCTMKLNATTEMEPITQPGWASIHPFAPLHQAAGYVELIRSLEDYLVEITGYDAVSVQPNAGSQGEFAGLMAIRGYHRSRGDLERTVCLIPSSAHGTNAASAVMAGMRVVVVACKESGEVDLDDLRVKIDEHAAHLAALMVTYPSTFGVYEETITEICALIHQAGGQVYVDGANLNALVGLAKPGKFGADVSHLNLHKTFCIPHGGGGPGVGPVAVRAHLAAFLPSHPMRPEAGPTARGYDDGGTGAISGAPWGSAGILPIPWAYIRLMGADGLQRATQTAVLNANYIARRLRDHYPVLSTGRDGLVAHECIVDVRDITKETGVTVDDVAKRLIDYGFHAPTMSFPVAGTLMIEPTESEDLTEIDRFCDAMIAIRGEIDAVAQGVWPVDDSPLRNAPHTAECLLGEWHKSYSRELAAYPLESERSAKYWPPVRRIDGAYGDRNLVCACPEPSAFEE